MRIWRLAVLTGVALGTSIPGAIASPPSAEAPALEDPSLVPPREDEQMRERPIGKAVWKPSKGVMLRTDDGRFALDVRLRVQGRYEARQDHETADLTQGFTIRRARIQFKGHVFGKHNKYYLQLAVSPRDMEWTADGPTFTPIRNWEISFDYLRDLTLTIGQMKKPYDRQRVISSGDLMMVDRALVTYEFNIDRDIGLMLSSNDLGGIGYLRYRLGVYTGDGRDAYQPTDAGLSYVAKVEVLPMGNAADDWDQDEMDWERSRKPSLSIGMGYAFNDRAKRERGSLGPFFVDGGTGNFHHAEADVMLKVAGLSLTGQFHFRDATRDFGDATVDDGTGMSVPAPHAPARNGVGYYLQAGFLVPRVPLDVSARWGQNIGLGGGSETSLADTDEVGAGLGWYVARHSLKLQTDYFRLRSDDYDVGSASFASGSWATSVDQVRIQLQLAF